MKFSREVLYYRCQQNNYDMQEIKFTLILENDNPFEQLNEETFYFSIFAQDRTDAIYRLVKLGNIGKCFHEKVIHKSDMREEVYDNFDKTFNFKNKFKRIELYEEPVFHNMTNAALIVND